MGPTSDVVSQALTVLNSETRQANPDPITVARQTTILVAQIMTALQHEQSNVVARIIKGCEDKALIALRDAFDTSLSTEGALLGRLEALAKSKPKFAKEECAARLKALSSSTGSAPASPFAALRPVAAAAAS
jgi:hypothetical protein